MDKTLDKIATAIDALAEEIRQGHTIESGDLETISRQLKAQSEMLREGIDL